jgi:ubiquitin carboxyl-terminal hydrolase L5
MSQAFFNVMLKEMGVRGVQIQEVLSLDEEMIMFLP